MIYTRNICYFGSCKSIVFNKSIVNIGLFCFNRFLPIHVLYMCTAYPKFPGTIAVVIATQSRIHVNTRELRTGSLSNQCLLCIWLLIDVILSCNLLIHMEFPVNVWNCNQSRHQDQVWLAASRQI